MVASSRLNTDDKPDNVRTSLTYDSMGTRDGFRKWLADGNALIHSPETVLSCMDRISEYAASRKMVKESLWEYVNPNTFSPIYNRLLGVKLLRITERKTYNAFITAGQLYLRFLKEASFNRNEVIDKEVGSTIVSELSSQKIIDPENVVKWLITQPNANGTLYLENVVRQYMSALRSAPSKLDVPIGLRDRNVFACYTPEELSTYWNIFKAAPNYRQVNSSTSGMFSAGMSCLLRYLQYLSKSPSAVKKTDSSGVIQLVKDRGLEYVDKLNSGGALWVIGGRELTAIMEELRDLGFYFRFKEGGGRSSDHKDAWWYKPADPYPTRVVSWNLANPALDPEMIEKFASVLSSHFVNGYRMNSPIELVRFRSFAAGDLGAEITLPDDELKRYILACGTAYNDKIFAVSIKAKEQIKELADEYFSDGAQVIFFAEFYAKNENWLF
ncbi:MAG TPA: hypothetical protein DDZ66_06460, partial [Firmicutes bacterium]|nr:hypothetical protein [Bacillota bacterium]